MKRIVLCLAAVAGLLAAGPAGAEPDASMVARVAPSSDVALPFWCDWGYDWDERCYRDFSDRLAVGGDVDKVWRAAIRFPVEAIPPGSVVIAGSLFMSFDGVCLGPRRTDRACPARSFTIDVHPVLSADWFREREIDVGPLAAQGSFWAGAPQRLSWDVTDLVIDWVEYGAPNNGLLLKLARGEENFFVGGPKLPAAEFSGSALRPALEVTYLPP